ncbi:hypothetical protein PF005_g15102 [Phytophthora fragariae]|uniref:Uncharacterized protein n=1 Tax=Phytophthora fragariae TaxID=53985 RepID=A0A6A3RSZ1_9STRA|nr:hypothetical protein PF011_g14039 [Phytophthora fragariae]KAE9099760.1 hypothetical protein PF007_g15754 [Phytophthora fragariae]KAE9136131.1 hypothetical protein PF006_g14458 [Phytophthora fragariae]KAE9201058.1 hypothetical protein PF005_g15102 [Phytophthora fragariae]KAE9217318.1 hypothetical protein PF002_g16836 [Phytophthora fragariae]
MVAMNRFDDVLLLYDSDNEPVEELVGGGKSESDDEDFQEGAVVCFAAAFTALSVREMFYARQRLIWSKHVQRSRDYVDEKNRVAPISEEVVLHCTLLGVSAILGCSERDIKLPATTADMDNAAAALKRESTVGVLDGCVGCVDRMLVKIATPTRKEEVRVICGLWHGRS